MRPFTTRLPPLAFALGLALAGPALADTPCAADAQRLCPGVQAGSGQVWACLNQKQLQLSSACVARINEVRRRAAEFHADCAGDIYRFCPAVQPGGRRVLDCLAAYVGRRELSSTCDAAVATAIEKLQEFAEGCVDDAATLCPGVAAGDGRLLLCLRSQEDRLSGRCRRAVQP